MGNQALALLAALGTACRNVDEFGQASAELFQTHPDYAIIASFPGLVASTGTRVLTEIEDDRTRFADTRALKACVGSAPASLQLSPSRLPGWLGPASLQSSRYRPPIPASTCEVASSTDVAAPCSGVFQWKLPLSSLMCTQVRSRSVVGDVSLQVGPDGAGLQGVGGDAVVGPAPGRRHREKHVGGLRLCVSVPRLVGAVEEMDVVEDHR